MMKRLNFLLILPRIVTNSNEGYQLPLGILYISAILKKRGFKVSTLNLNHIEGSVKTVLRREMLKNSIDIVACGGLSIQYNDLYEIFKCAKAYDENIITIAGGVIVTAEPTIAMDALEHVDYGVIGEGEITICELASALEEAKRDVRQISGIIFKMQGDYTITEKRTEIDDIDQITWPDYAGFELDKYLELAPPVLTNLGEKRLVSILGSRSCPYQCTFCLNSLGGTKYRQRSVENIIEEVAYLKDNFNVKFVYLEDDLFCQDKDRLRSFCVKMKKLNLPWRASFRVNCIDEETVKMLKRGGCQLITVGLESADNRILKSMKKKITLQQIESALSTLYKEKLPFIANFIFGDIAETVETALSTINWWLNHPQYNINLAMIVPYPGSYIYKYARQNNIIKDPIKYLKESCPTVNISKLTSQEMSWLAQNLLELPFQRANDIDNIQIHHKNKLINRVTFSGNCSVCGHFNLWREIKPFIGLSILCKQCFEKYNIPFPDELQQIVVNNFKLLLKQYGNIAIWGITFYSLNLLKKHDLFRNESIFLIDNAAFKQMILIGQKTVNPPSILEKEIIKVVIVFYSRPTTMQSVSSQIRSLYPAVENVINICDLVH